MEANMKVNTKVMIDTKYIYVFCTSSRAEKFTSKTIIFANTELCFETSTRFLHRQTYVIIISCSKEWRHSKCWLPLRGWENFFSSLCVYVSHWKKGKVVHLSGWIWLQLVLCLVLLETKWVLCCKITISQNRRFAEIDFSKMIQLWYNSICQHRHSTTLSLAQLLINIILP